MQRAPAFTAHVARPQHNTDLHGSAPDTSGTALLLIDVLNDFSFKGGAALASEALKILDVLVSLKAGARTNRVPVIYVNDNTGKWRSDSAAVVKKALAPGSRGRAVVRRLKPGPRDYLILKPKQSAFYGTPLEILLDYLKVRRLVIAGFTADICIFFTAQDAFVRDYDIIIPSDAVASQSRDSATRSLRDMHRLFEARICAAAAVKWKGR
jgi:nicotinamidase-related amidase